MTYLNTNTNLIGTINSAVKLTGNISDNRKLKGNITLKTKYKEYEGIYEITPSNKQTILETNNKVLYKNIIVNPIPSRYGLITWNGQTLTVS